MFERLDKGYASRSDFEIQQSLFAIGNHKSPGPDGVIDDLLKVIGR